MSDRAVHRTGKDRDGDITKLCGETTDFWSPRIKSDAINDIEAKMHTYHVSMAGGGKVPIHVVTGPNGKYLRSNWDGTTRNNLDDLPDC